MEFRKKAMKEALAESLRELMQKKLFEKITIKNICDETGVIRATFYNYYDDKYDCLNQILHFDIVEQNEELLKRGDIRGVIKSVLTVLEENRAFYRSAFNVTGQNSFSEMFRDNLIEVFQIYLKEHRKPGHLPQYEDRLLSRYYASGVLELLYMYIFEKEVYTAEEVTQFILDLSRTSFMDFVKPDDR